DARLAANGPLSAALHSIATVLPVNRPVTLAPPAIQPADPHQPTPSRRLPHLGAHRKNTASDRKSYSRVQDPAREMPRKSPARALQSPSDRSAYTAIRSPRARRVVMHRQRSFENARDRKYT